MTKYALVSVSDTTGLAKLKALTDAGWVLIATSGTRSALAVAGVPAIEVETFTGMPEVLGGRVKTLHPKLFGGTLADRDSIVHTENLIKTLKGVMIDLVIINFYPFMEKPGIKNIDIGGPSHVRAAAKNHAHVSVVVDPFDYDEVVSALIRDGEVPFQTRARLAAQAFEYTARYDIAIAKWMAGETAQRIPWFG